MRKEYFVLFIFTLFSLPCHTPRWPLDALAQHQKYWPATQEDFQLPLCCEGQPGAEEPRCVQHLLWMDISAGPHTLGSKNTIGTSGLKPTSWQWQSTNSTTTNVFNCMTKKKMLSTKPIWTSSSGRKLRLSSTPTAWTRRMVLISRRSSEPLIHSHREHSWPHQSD